MRGIAHIGVLEGLAGLDVRPEAVAGTSSGALVAAGYAALGWPTGRMAAAVAELGPLAMLGLVARRPLLEPLAPVLCRLAGELPCLLDELERWPGAGLAHGVKRLGITCVDLVTRREEMFVWGSPALPEITLSEGVRGSSALPLLLPGVTVMAGGRRLRLVDGGLSRAVPVERMFEPPIDAGHVLAIDLGVATGWNERRLDRREMLRRRFGDRLMIVRPDVGRFGTVMLKRGDPERLIRAGRVSIGPEVARWLRAASLTASGG